MAYLQHGMALTLTFQDYGKVPNGNEWNTNTKYKLTFVTDDNGCNHDLTDYDHVTSENTRKFLSFN